MTEYEDQKAVITRMEESLNTLHSANECLRSKNRSLIDKNEIQRVETETLEMEKIHIQVEVQDLKIALEKSEALYRDSHNALTREKEDHKQTKYRLVREEQIVESLQNKLHYEESCCRESNQDLARQMENVRRLESELRRRQTGTGDSEHFPFPSFPFDIRVSSDLTWEDHDASEEYFAWDEEQESIEPSPAYYKYDEQDLTEQPSHTYQSRDSEAEAPRQSRSGRENSQPLKVCFFTGS
jgi:chromosome segregation ATPase